jgi:DNA-binding transcriptional regulator LsrR (DeoR family)
MIKLFHRDMRPPPLPMSERRKSGRKRALGSEEADRVRWMYKHTKCSLQRVADHFHVSQATVLNVINRKGAYKNV